MQGKRVWLWLLVGLLVFFTSVGVVYFFRLGQVQVQRSEGSRRDLTVMPVKSDSGLVVEQQALAEALEVLPVGTASAGLKLTVSDFVPAKKNMQMFHAADVGMTPAYGCSWRVTDGVVDLTMHLNKVRLEEVFADANERDQVIGKFMLTCAARADTGMEGNDPRLEALYLDIEKKLAELAVPVIGVE